MSKNERTKNIVLAVLLVAVITLSIAYAVLSTQLTINAQTTVKGSNWDIEFQQKSGYTPICVASSRAGAASTTASVTTQPTLNATSFSGLEAEFRLPGDKVVCTWEVTNAGGIDAKLATFTKPTVSELTYVGTGADQTADENLIKGNFNYTLTVDGSTPQVGNTLPATTNNTKTVVLTIEFDDQCPNLPAQDVTVSGFNTTFVYQQN